MEAGYSSAGYVWALPLLIPQSKKRERMEWRDGRSEEEGTDPGARPDKARAGSGRGGVCFA